MLATCTSPEPRPVIIDHETYRREASALRAATQRLLFRRAGQWLAERLPLRLMPARPAAAMRQLGA